MTYRPVPVADDRHRPTKASLPQRRCVRPKGPGSVWEKRRHESVAEPTPDDERRDGDREVHDEECGHRRAVQRARSRRLRPPLPNRMLISSIRTATIATSQQTGLEVAVLAVPALRPRGEARRSSGTGRGRRRRSPKSMRASARVPRKPVVGTWHSLRMRRRPPASRNRPRCEGAHALIVHATPPTALPEPRAAPARHAPRTPTATQDDDRAAPGERVSSRRYRTARRRWPGPPRTPPPTPSDRADGHDQNAPPWRT